MLSLRLVHPDPIYRESFLAALGEFDVPAEKIGWVYMGQLADLNRPVNDFPGYVQMLRARETSPPLGFVRDTTYWAVASDESGDQVIGRIAIRHEMNDLLRKIGGHIGYIVRPSWRKRGVASEMLRQILQTEKAREFEQVLLTCDEHNLASEKTILKNGGVYENTVEVGIGSPRKKRFWIRMASRTEI